MRLLVPETALLCCRKLKSMQSLLLVAIDEAGPPKACTIYLESITLAKVLGLQLGVLRPTVSPSGGTTFGLRTAASGKFGRLFPKCR